VGITYGLSATAFALVYNTTRIFHLAAVGFYVFSAYVCWYVGIELGFGIAVGVIASMILTTLLSVLSEVLVYKPLYNNKCSGNVIMISSIGLMTIIVNTIAMVFGNEARTLNETVDTSTIFLGLTISGIQIIQLMVGVSVIAAFLYFLKFSSLGLKARALANDNTLFEVLGEDLAKTRIQMFALSGLFFAIASSLICCDTGLDPHMGMTVITNAVVAMIIGGIGSFNVCILGGIILGVLQSIAVFYFSASWQDAITFSLLIIFLLFRPQGLFGVAKRKI